MTEDAAQSWAVLSSAADRPRAAAAMEAVLRHLVNEHEGLILLLTPTFVGATQDPGDIRAYPPAVRENGGQYTHAAIWVLWGLVELGEVDRAVGLLQRLLPIRHALAPEAVAPVLRDGCYRLGLEAILGLRRCGGAWSVDPSHPGQRARIRARRPRRRNGLSRLRRELHAVRTAASRSPSSMANRSTRRWCLTSATAGHTRSG